MTKQIRIENADTSDYEVVVEIYHKDPAANSFSEALKETHILPHPTAMLSFTLWEGRYLKVYERPKAK